VNIGADEAASVLATRAASDSALDDLYSVTWLLGTLRAGRAQKAVCTLAFRVVEEITIEGSGRFNGLLKTLRYAEVDDAFSALTVRAANAGLWQSWLTANPDMKPQYKFGRQPDGAASAPWGWQSLINAEPPNSTVAGT
jgi:hypothetical protein